MSYTPEQRAFADQAYLDAARVWSSAGIVEARERDWHRERDAARKQPDLPSWDEVRGMLMRSDGSVYRSLRTGR